jgi:hydroxyacylglutathione hydrolase
MIGLERVAGYFDEHVLAAWQSAEGALATVPQIGPADLAESIRHGGVTLVDVRNQAEWDAGHIDGARHIPLGRLAARLAEIPREKPVVLQCEAGARSSIGASVLQANGFDRVINLAGGYNAWVQESTKYKVQSTK